MDFDPAKERARVADTFGCGTNQVLRAKLGLGQAYEHLPLEGREGVEARSGRRVARRGYLLGKVEPRRPGFGESRRCGATKTGQILDSVELSQGYYEGLSDRRLQVVGINRAEKTAGQACRQLLDGEELEALPGVERGLGAVAAPSMAIGNEECLAQARSLAEEQGGFCIHVNRERGSHKATISVTNREI